VADTYEIKVEPGRVIGMLHANRSRESVTAEWAVPRKTPSELERFVRELADDPLLAGRWSTGRPTEEDRRRADADERGWRSSCDCGMRQPCRHAQSVLFQLRTDAKSNPWLWLEAAGLETPSLNQAIREARAALAANRSTAAQLEAELMMERAKQAAAEQAEGIPTEPAALRLPAEPAFWNRDVSFADWLRPLLTHVRKKEGIHDHVNETGRESDVTLDSHVHQRS
jgi:hypothetical protein